MVRTASDFDPDTLRRMYSYSGTNLFEPRDVVEEIFHEYAEATWELNDFLDLIREIAERVPEAARQSAIVRLNGDYESTGSLAITFSRKETEAEIEKRITRAVEYAWARQKSERQTYKKLKRKFEP